MIDIEPMVYTKVAQAIRAKYPTAYINSNQEIIPSSYPAITFSEEGNTIATRYASSSKKENFIRVLYEANVYSNKKVDPKSEIKDIMRIIDEVMVDMGFTRTYNQNMVNVRDTNIQRRLGRWTGTTDGKTIYRR